MGSKNLSLLISGTFIIVVALTGCDAVGLGTKIPKCDDPLALELTGKLALSSARIEDNTLRGWESVSQLMNNDPTLIATEMILNQGVEKDIGRNSCVASFVFSSSNIEPTEETCKFVTRAEYSLQYDTTGKLVSTVTQQSPLSCVMFTQQEIEARRSSVTDSARQTDLGLKYERGDGVPQDYAEAAKWYRKAAEQGEPMAQYYLGHLYLKGNGVAQDFVTAAYWYRKSAEQGNYAAQNDLGVLYFQGDGVPQNYAEAAKWYRKGADQGDALSQANLGDLYFNGQGVPQDYAEAAGWYRKAADQGVASAQAALGYLHSAGKGVAEDYAESAKWYRLAAKQGYGLAQVGLGILYTYGRGVPRDVATARQWWSKVSAADSSSDTAHSLAVYNLGESYYAGEEFGATADVDKARMHWMQVLRSTKAPESTRNLAALGLMCIEERLSSTQCAQLRCSIEGRPNCPKL